MTICRFTAENKARTRYAVTSNNQRQPFARINLTRQRPIAVLREVSTSELEVLSAFLHELRDGGMRVKP